MSSEAITRNDLIGILNEVLPPTPSEYKKLLWTNPNPATEFAAQTITMDLTDYDEVEVWFNCWRNRADTSLQFRVKKGTYGIATQGASSNTSSGINPFVVGSYIIVQDRPIYVTNTGVQFGTCTEGASNGTIYNANGSMIPAYIYGIKYERVAPPQVDASDYVIEQDVKTASDGTVWNCRKWNSGVAECWCKVFHTITGWTAWYSWYYSRPDILKFSFPTNFFIDVPIVEASRSSGIAGVLCEEGAPSATQTQQYYLIRPDAPSASGFNLDIHAIGKWK